ncbi:MAG: tetratricopeptide repeat protein [Leptospirales bacterium]
MTPPASVGPAGELIRKGRFPEALELLDREEPERGRDSGVETLRGMAQEGLGLLGPAEESYWKAVASESNRSPLPFLLLGLLKDRTDDRKKALWVLDEGLRLFPGDPDLLREAGILHGLEGRWPRALPLILDAHRRSPSSPENILALASAVDTLEIIDLYATMNRNLELLLSANPDNPDIQDWYGRSLERIEKSSQALKFFRKLLRKTPRSRRLMRHVARLAANVNEFGRSLDTFRLLMEEEGETCELCLLMAETHKMAGKPLAALPFARRALAIAPERGEARLLLGQILIDTGDAEKAGDALSGIDSSAAHYQLGELWLRKKRPEMAAAALHRGFLIRPDPYYIPELLKLLAEFEDTFTFLETLAFVRILFPETPVSGRLLGRVADRLQQGEQRESDDAHRLATEGLARAFLPREDRLAAYRSLEQAVTVDPLSEVPYWVLAMIDEDRKDWKAALGWYERILSSTREPVTLLHRIAENRHNLDPTTDLLPLAETFSGIYGPRPGFTRVLFEVASRSPEKTKALRILEAGMEAFPQDPSLFALYRSLEPERWRRLFS